MYKLDEIYRVVRDSDGAIIPMIPGNRDYDQYKKWVDAGGVIGKIEVFKDYATRRREEYNRRGVTMEAIAEALIEHAGGKSQKLQYLMQIRDEVRAEIPKT
jgi:hypothetical protein